MLNFEMLSDQDVENTILMLSGFRSGINYPDKENTALALEALITLLVKENKRRGRTQQLLDTTAQTFSRLVAMLQEVQKEGSIQ